MKRYYHLKRQERKLKMVVIGSGKVITDMRQIYFLQIHGQLKDIG